MNILSLNDFSENQILKIISDAQDLKKEKIFKKEKKLIALLFFEPSTRTQYSFEIAAKTLGYDVITFNEETSSVKKGETLYDTCLTFQEMGVDCLVIRHSDKNYFEQLKDIKIPIINGGDGAGEHPSQCLLDLMTIKEEFQEFANLNILIAGDIKYSRVANSNIQTFKRLKMNIQTFGPELLANNKVQNFDEIIKSLDVLMLLRVQKERHGINIDNYLENYGLTINRYETLKEKCIIMHPGPYNRNIEIDTTLIESEKSRILKQVTNGVYIRMVLLKGVFHGIHS